MGFELRLPPLVDFDRAQTAFARAVNATFPSPGPAPETTTVGLGLGEAHGPPRPRGIRRLDRRRQRSVVLTPESLVVETSAYGPLRTPSSRTRRSEP